MRKLKNSELERISTEDFKNAKKSPIILVLDNIRSAMNVGSVFRTADAFLIEKIYLCGITATPPNKELLKTALGANNSVDWEYVEETPVIIKKLKKDNHHIVGVEQTEKATLLNNFEIPNKKIALIFGNEVFGVNQESIDLCDECIEIPQFGTKHSLNISVSAGIVIWEIWKNYSKEN
jgi:tRNA G18 (ribose-2'-O)-methylase SpoU|tara:strand:+ start:243 stop:776 length:534 start_codon:yes stop_codon:yes gene_type:complete